MGVTKFICVTSAVAAALIGGPCAGQSGNIHIPPGTVIPARNLNADHTANMNDQRPSFGERRTAAVGEPIFTWLNYAVSLSARLRQTIDVGGGDRDHHRVPNTEILNYGSDDDDVPQACTQTLTDTQRHGGRQSRSCFSDGAGDGFFDSVHRDGSGGSTIELGREGQYDLIPNWVVSINFRHELVYLGSSGGALRVAYREYSNGMARPALANDLTFDINPAGPTSFRYRNIRVTVFTSDSDGISYVVNPA